MFLIALLYNYGFSSRKFGPRVLIERTCSRFHPDHRLHNLNAATVRRSATIDL